MSGLKLAVVTCCLMGLATRAMAAVPSTDWATVPAPPAVAIEQRLNAPLPLGLAFTDGTGQTVRLQRYVDGEHPVILVLGYSRCAQLCGTIMHSILQALRDTKLDSRAYRILGVSIDPAETPRMAATQAAAYLSAARQMQGHDTPGAAHGWPPKLDLLVGSRASVSALATQVGFQFQITPERAQPVPPHDPGIAHASGLMVITPDGRVSRYFLGVTFDAQALRLALVDASGGQIGSLVDRLVLRCAHLDPTLGRYTLSVMTGLRIGGVMLALGLATWIWRHRKAPRKAMA